MEILESNIFFQLSKKISDELGLYFPLEKKHDLERGLSKACLHFGYNNINECAAKLALKKLEKFEIEILASYLTIGETYFLREEKVFAILINNLIPSLIKNDPQKNIIKIWVAGCCTGEEAYSIAIILEQNKHLFPNIKFEILATDINPEFLSKAESAIYSQWSFRNANSLFKTKYFTETSDKKYLLNNDIKSKVKFNYLNLVESSYPSLIKNIFAVDIIFCRNVLMYFNEETRKSVLHNFSNTLTSDGFVIVSANESSNIYQDYFNLYNIPEVIIYQKKNPLKVEQEIKSKITSLSFSKEIDIISIKNEIDTIKAKILKKDIKTISSEKEKPQTNFIDDINFFYNEGKYDYAIQLINNIFTANNSDLTKEIKTDLYIYLIKSYANIGKLEDAIIKCDAAIKFDKINPHFYFLLSSILLSSGNLDQAIIEIKRALFLDHDFILGYFTLGNIYTKINNPNEAKKNYDIALKILENLPENKQIKYSDGLSNKMLKEIIKSFTNTLV